MVWQLPPPPHPLVALGRGGFLTDVLEICKHQWNTSQAILTLSSPKPRKLLKSRFAMRRVLCGMSVFATLEAVLVCESSCLKSGNCHVSLACDRHDPHIGADWTRTIHCDFGRSCCTSNEASPLGLPKRLTGCPARHFVCRVFEPEPSRKRHRSVTANACPAMPSPEPTRRVE